MPSGISKYNQSGWKHTKETKEKNRQKQLGHSPTKGFSGRKHSEKSKSKQGSPGEKNPSFGMKGPLAFGWKGGKTTENYRIRRGIEFRLWRQAVWARDNWTCQKYGVRGGKLVAHHIQNFAQYPELRFAIDNGITLSVKAHNEFHKKYGYKDNNKEQLIGFLDTMTKQIGGGKAPAPVAPMPAGAIE